MKDSQVFFRICFFERRHIVTKIAGRKADSTVGLKAMTAAFAGRFHLLPGSGCVFHLPSLIQNLWSSVMRPRPVALRG